MHATEKLDTPVTLEVPVKFLSAITRALIEAAEAHQIFLKHKPDMDIHERATREACILCYGEVYDVVSELVRKHLTEEDVTTLQKVAIATIDSAITNKGVLN